MHRTHAANASLTPDPKFYIENILTCVRCWPQNSTPLWASLGLPGPSSRDQSKSVKNVQNCRGNGPNRTISGEEGGRRRGLTPLLAQDIFLSVSFFLFFIFSFFLFVSFFLSLSLMIFIFLFPFFCSFSFYRGLKTWFFFWASISFRFAQAVSLRVTVQMFVWLSFCCMAWCHIRELVWNWLDTQSRLKVVAAGRDPWLQSGLDFGTARNSLSSFSMRSITPTSSQSVGNSPVPQSPLQASPMNVEHALGCSAVMGQLRERVADRLSQANLAFHALEFVRSDHGIWAHEHNAASLPLGCLSSTTWIRRLQSVSIVRPVDAGNPWTWKGRTMSNSVLVRFYVAEEGNDAGFDVRGQDVHLNAQSHVGHEDLGELLPASASLDHRTEVVLDHRQLLLRWTITFLAYTGVPTESDDTFALDCTDSLDLQKPCTTPYSWCRHWFGRVCSKLSRRQHLVGLLLDLDFQVPRYDVPHVMALKAGLLSSHCESLPSGLALDGTVLTQQRRLHNAKKRDLEDSKAAFLVRGDSSIADSSELLYSLDMARKCGELETAGLLCGDSSEGRAENVRRQSAANFNGRVQQCDGDGDQNNVMESKKAQNIITFHHSDIYECSHIAFITTPVHCCLQHPFPYTQWQFGTACSTPTETC